MGQAYSSENGSYYVSDWHCFSLEIFTRSQHPNLFTQFNVPDEFLITIYYIIFRAKTAVTDVPALFLRTQVLRSWSRCWLMTRLSPICPWQTSGNGRWAWPVVRQEVSAWRRFTCCCGYCSVLLGGMCSSSLSHLSVCLLRQNTTDSFKRVKRMLFFFYCQTCSADTAKNESLDHTEAGEFPYCSPKHLHLLVEAPF